MPKNLSRAIKIEFNFIKQSKVNLILYLAIPFLFAFLFGLFGSINVSWKPETTYFILYAPQVLTLFVLFISTQLIIMRIVGERTPYGTLDRDLLSLSKESIFFGKFIIYCIISLIQAYIVFLISFFVFGLPVNPILFLLILTLTSFFGVALGLTISTISSNKEQASQIAPFVILILFIFNNSIISLESLKNLPLATVTDSLTRMINFNHGFYELKTNIFFSILWIFIVLTIGYTKFKLESLRR